jgi:O-antigen/teichoic acid export membrane protein
MSSSALPRQHILGGTVRVFGAELLALPTGLVTAVFLSRQFGPSGYGLFSLAAVLIMWLEWTVASIFSKAAIKFIAEADDWMGVGAAVLRWYAATSCGAALVLWLLADSVAGVLGEPRLAGYLRLFALDIPIFNLAQAHHNILIGVGRFAERARMAAARWVTRLLLIVLLVESGWGIEGAILGSIGASVVELLVGRWHVRPPLFRASGFPVRAWLNYAVPLFLYSVVLGFYGTIGLFALKVLGGTAEQAGVYSAAQNFTIVPGILAGAFSPLLLAALARALRDDDVSRAKVLGRHAMRGVLLLLPFAGMTVALSGEAVTLVLGGSFLGAAPPLDWLIFGALALLMVAVATAQLTAAGRPGLAFGLTAAGLPCAVIGYLVAVPHWPVQGAAVATTLAALLAAIATVAGVYRIWRIAPPRGTAVRAAVICGIAYAEGALWITPGFLLLAKVAVIALSIGVAYLALGEFDSSEVRWMAERMRVLASFRRETGR